MRLPFLLLAALSTLCSAAPWEFAFDARSSTLTLRHPATGARLAGRLSFTAQQNASSTAWTIQDPRDSVPNRLAILDTKNDVQGYVTITATENTVQLAALPRPRHMYNGELKFTPKTSLGPNSFACRTNLPAAARVIQMASGPADSRLNDSVFDPAQDRLLTFRARRVAILTQPASSGTPPTFLLDLASAPLESISIEVQPNYYRAHYVPDYHPIDRTRVSRAPTGWMSWNVYFDAATEDDNLAEARLAARVLKPFGLEFWSIESWQENSEKLPVSDFHNLNLRASPAKFPHGMEWLAKQIRQLGFRPGIWTVPWGTGDAGFYRDHRDWFLHDSKGKPMQNWSGRYLLDPSQPEVRDYIEGTFRKMSREWGYEFFKVDGMSGADRWLSAHFLERPEVRAAFRRPVDDPYRLMIETFRRGMGPDRVFLACQGHYTGPEAAFVDSARLGADLVEPGIPPQWHNYLNQATFIQAQLFTNNLSWYNDPDTLMVGEPAPLSSARIAATAVALPGQLTFISDRLARLPAPRLRLLQQALPVCDVHPLDLLPAPDLRPIWDLKLRRNFAQWDVVSVFNWSDQIQDFRLGFAELGLDATQSYLVYDFWSHSLLGALRHQAELRIEPRANRLLAIHPLQPHPQFLSTNRHLTQGGVELTDVVWNPRGQQLEATLNLVANDPLTLALHVPAGYAFVAAASEDASVERAAAPLPLLVVVAKRPNSGPARITLRFRPQP